MIITPESLAGIRNDHPAEKIVLLKGTFDLIHPGHVNRMRNAKAFGDLLVVFVKCDEAIKLKGPDRPIENEDQRATMVDAIRYVDYTVIANRKDDAGISDVPERDRDQYLRYYRMIRDLRPDILVKPEKELPPVLTELYQSIGTQIRVVPETPGISTTMLIRKIRGEKEEAL